MKDLPAAIILLLLIGVSYLIDKIMRRKRKQNAQ